MNRRAFLQTSLGAAAGAALLPVSSSAAEPPPNPLLTYRFGVNYTPSKNWYYCWNDFDPDAIARDFDAVAALGADHLRVMLLWPSFQPNPGTVSRAHLDRLNRLMQLAGERKLAVCASMLNGWLSGFVFLPPFLYDRSKFYESDAAWQAAEVYFREVAAVVNAHANFLGFDLGNEMNCCWSTPDLAKGGAWLDRALTLCEKVSPQAAAHVEGADHQPWFRPTTFPARKLATRQRIVALHCWSQFTGALDRGGTLDRPAIWLGAAMAALARAYAGDVRKPVWVQEYGASTTWMNGEDIPAYVEQTTLAGVVSGVSWHTWWASHDVDRRFRFDELEYGLGLLTVENKPKDAARAFRAVAEAHRGKPVTLPPDGPVLPLPEKPTPDATWEWLRVWIGEHARVI